jgi:hypothetical protein
MEGDKEPPYAAGKQQLEEGDEEEDEFHDFRSKHLSGYNTPEAEPLALDFTAEKPFKMMEDGFYGCSVDEHIEQLQEHVTRHSNNHHGLEALFSDPTFPSVLSLSEYITPERLQR